MALPAGTTVINGFALTPDGALYVTLGSGAAAGQSAAAALGLPFILAKSFVQVAAPLDTAENILATITIPANALGANGGIRVAAAFAYTNSANNKTFKARYSGIGGTQYFSLVVTTQLSLRLDLVIGNRNATNSQVGTSTYFTNGGLLNTQTVSAVDTTASTTIVLTATKATGAEAATLEWYTAELLANGA